MGRWSFQMITSWRGDTKTTGRKWHLTPQGCFAKSLYCHYYLKSIITIGKGKCVIGKKKKNPFCLGRLSLWTDFITVYPGGQKQWESKKEKLISWWERSRTDRYRLTIQSAVLTKAGSKPERRLRKMESTHQRRIEKEEIYCQGIFNLVWFLCDCFQRGRETEGREAEMQLQPLSRLPVTVGRWEEDADKWEWVVEQGRFSFFFSLFLTDE